MPIHSGASGDWLRKKFAMTLRTPPSLTGKDPKAPDHPRRLTGKAPKKADDRKALPVRISKPATTKKPYR
jgi:hypothetical protein